MNVKTDSLILVLKMLYKPHFRLVKDKYTGPKTCITRKIDPVSDRELNNFLRQGRARVLELRGYGDCRPDEEMVAEYVHEKIPYAEREAFDDEMEGSLGRFVKGGAVCLEMALFAHLLLAEVGAPSVYVGGFWDSWVHAWVEVPRRGTVLEPQHGRVYRLEDLSKRLRVEEREVLAEPV